MVTRGRVNGGWAGEPVWAVREGAFTNLGGVDAAKAAERLVSTDGGVCLRYCEAEVDSEGLLAPGGVPAHDVDKLGADIVEGGEAGILEGAKLGGEEFVGADINLGGAGISC